MRASIFLRSSAPAVNTKVVLVAGSSSRNMIRATADAISRATSSHSPSPIWAAPLSLLKNSRAIKPGAISSRNTTMIAARLIA
jgi:hypothetical protein